MLETSDLCSAQSRLHFAELSTNVLQQRQKNILTFYLSTSQNLYSITFTWVKDLSRGESVLSL